MGEVRGRWRLLLMLKSELLFPRLVNGDEDSVIEMC